jgi:hypothetical protein
MVQFYNVDESSKLFGETQQFECFVGRLPIVVNILQEGCNKSCIFSQSFSRGYWVPVSFPKKFPDEHNLHAEITISRLTSKKYLNI